MSSEHIALARRLSLALQAADLGSWTWHAGSRVLDLDARARDILGLAPQVDASLEAVGEIVHEADRREREAAFDRAFGEEGTGDYRIEFRIRRQRDGQERWIESHAQWLHDAAGQTTVIGLVRDVTDLRLAEMADRHSEAKLAEVFSIAADAIILIDAEQRITLFNTGAEKIFGYAANEVVGGPLGLLLPERFRTAHRGHVRAFGRSPTASRRMGERASIYGLRKSGEEFAADASIAHVRLDGETVFAVVLRDVSDVKRAEALLLQSRAELEQRVAERTRELRAEMQRREETQALLVRAQRMEAFGQLTGGIAHDFNNLLTVVTGNLELLEMRITDPKARTLLQRAQDAAEMGARLTGRLLTFARRRQLETRPIDLNEQVAGMVDLLHRTLGGSITLETNLDPQLWSVRADPSEVENAILNLAINARDAMPTGGTLRIETGNVSISGEASPIDARLADGDYARLSVSDTGLGMSPEVLAHACEPFFTTKQAGKGTGLGLSTIYGFVNQQGGTISLVSEPGQGTTVALYLPRMATTVPEQAIALPMPVATVPGAGGELVLLVEDNPEVRQVTRAELESLGYRVLTADSGPAAIAQLESGREVELVLSDVEMAGGMSGLDVVRWVQANRPALKTLLTTGYAEQLADRQRELSVRVLQKPYRIQDLARAVRLALDT